jgi:ElaB/YqjD/DUF883 family membrane-anchored ribosome-binding protein
MAVHRGTHTKTPKSTSDLPTAISEAADRAQSGARHAVAEAASGTSELSAAAGDRLQSAAEAIRARAPREGMLGTAATAVADRLEGAGLYLQEENFVAMADDLASVIRRYPVQSLLIGASIGFLLGRLRR